MPEEVVDRHARSEMDAHNRVCAERYGSLWQAISDLKTAIGELKEMIRTSEATMHVRYTAVSTRLWLMLAGVAAGAIGACGAIVFYLLTRGS